MSPASQGQGQYQVPISFFKLSCTAEVPLCLTGRRSGAKGLPGGIPKDEVDCLLLTSEPRSHQAALPLTDLLGNELERYGVGRLVLDDAKWARNLFSGGNNAVVREQTLYKGLIPYGIELQSPPTLLQMSVGLQTSDLAMTTVTGS